MKRLIFVLAALPFVAFADAPLPGQQVHPVVRWGTQGVEQRGTANGAANVSVSAGDSTVIVDLRTAEGEVLCKASGAPVSVGGLSGRRAICFQNRAPGVTYLCTKPGCTAAMSGILLPLTMDLPLCFDVSEAVQFRCVATTDHTATLGLRYFEVR
jgi:hypothetical protein